jgi:hypothetical protein
MLEAHSEWLTIRELRIYRLMLPERLSEESFGKATIPPPLLLQKADGGCE